MSPSSSLSSSFLIVVSLLLLLLALPLCTQAAPYFNPQQKGHPAGPHVHKDGQASRIAHPRAGAATVPSSPPSSSSSSSSPHEVIATIPGARCTNGGDIFPKRWSGRIDRCHLSCRSSHTLNAGLFSWSVPADCAWRGEWTKQSMREWEDFRKNERERTLKLQQQQEEEHAYDLENVQEVWHQHTTTSVLLLMISNFAWLPIVIWGIHHRLIFEPLLGVSVCCMMSLFHACKDGLFCVAPYSLLFFLDAWIGASGIFLIFVHTAILRPSWFRKMLYAAVLAFGVTIATVSYLHQHPQQLSLAVACMLVIGVVLVTVRYSIIDRTAPTIIWFRLSIAWCCVLVGMGIQALGQQYMHYPLAHSLWHCLTAIAGYFSISAALPTGHLLTIDEVLHFLRLSSSHGKITPKAQSQFEMNQPKNK